MAMIIEIKVVPHAGRQHIVLDTQGHLKCFLKSAPERGKANDELIAFLAKKLGEPRMVFEIIGGATGRHKKIKIITTLSYEQILARLGFGAQSSIAR